MPRWRPAQATAALLLAFGVHAASAQSVASRCSPGVHDEGALGTVGFPQDQIFCPLLADPKEARSFVALLRGTFPSLDEPAGDRTTIAAVGLGDSFGLVRWGGPSPGEGLQLDVMGSIFAQFDLGTSSNDLINADYVIGLPLTFRRSGFSARVRIYHQSSHLGDDYLLRDTEIERENLSFESAEIIVSQELGPLRVYVGGERVFRREPDVKSPERSDWSPAISGRAGIEVVRRGPGGHPGRMISLMLEAYDGPSPYGQFFQDDISYVGVGLHFGL
jgi:hypothetical protein